jgi:O-antigen ligase
MSVAQAPYSSQHTLPYSSLPAMTKGKKNRRGLGDWYLIVMCFLLAGYAIGGRGFAYWGIWPIYVGELGLALGFLAMFFSGAVGKLLRIPTVLWLIVFVVWCIVCTVPYVEKYGADAVRDAVLWGYAGFTFTIAAVLISKPTRLKWLIEKYALFVILFLVLTPLTAGMSRFAEDSIPRNPLNWQPIFQVKLGDVCVHIAGVYAFLIALGSLSRLNAWVAALLLCLNLGINLQGRAGIVAFGATILLCFVLRPTHHRGLKVLFILLSAVFVLWFTGVRFAKYDAREISFDGLVDSMLSVVGKGQVGDVAHEGSRTWRLKWWSDIIDRTVNGPKFLTGDGFGINLAKSYGYQDADPELRSPHNGHMTVLARTGVPGFAIWCGLQLSWAWAMFRSYVKTRRNRDWKWSGLFMFLLAYWVALTANTGFDVFLEGPMGGIWIWSVFGVGIAALYIYKRCPEALYMNEEELQRHRMLSTVVPDADPVGSRFTETPVYVEMENEA